MNDNNIGILAPFLFEKVKHIHGGGNVDFEEAQELLIKADLLIAHYRRKREKIAYKMHEELQVIDVQIEMADSFRQTFFRCIKK